MDLDIELDMNFGQSGPRHRLGHKIQILGLKPKILIMNLLDSIIDFRFKAHIDKVEIDNRKNYWTNKEAHLDEKKIRNYVQ